MSTRLRSSARLSTLEQNLVAVARTPDVCRWLLSEILSVRFERALILTSEVSFVARFTLTWVVVDELADQVSHLFPVGPGEDQVRVPDFVDDEGRCNAMVAKHGKTDEALVLSDRSVSKVIIPVLFVGEALRERVWRILLVDAKRIDLPDESSRVRGCAN